MNTPLGPRIFAKNAKKTRSSSRILALYRCQPASWRGGTSMKLSASIGSMLLMAACAAAAAAASAPQPPRSAVTHHTIVLRGRNLSYTATVEENIIDDCDSHPGAAVITIAYTQDHPAHLRERPILFAFNGGPGASSSPLHMSAFGPVGRSDSAKGKTHDTALSSNRDSPLDVVDLVFIDPVSTGFSRPFPSIDPKQWYAGPADALEVAYVIEHWLKAHHRETSPRYLAGESYGATRAALILKYAPTLKWNGVLLISGGGGSSEGDGPQIGVIAPMAAGAWFHNKIARQGRSVDEVFHEAGQFAEGAYAEALAQGDRLNEERRHEVAEKLSAFIGLPAGLIEENKLRVSDNLYMFNLLKDRALRTGLLDTRITDALVENAAGGIDDPALGVVKPQANGAVPTPESVGAVVSPTVGGYISRNLKFATAEPYYGVNFKVNVAWDYHGLNQSKEEPVPAILARALIADRSLRLFTVSGYFDLNARDGSSFLRAGVPADRYTQLMLPGPHEVYQGDENHKAFNDAVRRFVTP